MKPPIVYLDTSFFIGLIDDVADRRQDAKDVVRYETTKQSKLYTSILTINEFTVKTYDKFRKHPDCDQKIEEAVKSIRDIALIYAINDEVVKESARLMSVWGEFRKLGSPPLPRDRKFRWDSLHIATAQVLRADRVYSFDAPWNEFPKHEIPNIKQIISPASTPQPNLKASE